MRAYSHGGGVQSTAALVLAAQGRIDFRLFLFANVGEDSERIETLDYLRNVAKPYAVANGIELREIARPGETLLERTKREDKSIGIPVRMRNGAPGNRNCSLAYKARVVRDYLGKGDHVVGIGISWDEIGRMRTDSGFKNVVNEYPLIDMRLTKKACVKIIADAGLPVPPKSACWFCPYHKLSEWAEMRRDEPELFAQAVALEQLIFAKREALGKDRVFLTRKGVPLEQAVPAQPSLLADDDEDNCESGYCMV